MNPSSSLVWKLWFLQVHQLVKSLPRCIRSDTSLVLCPPHQTAPSPTSPPTVTRSPALTRSCSVEFRISSQKPPRWCGGPTPPQGACVISTTQRAPVSITLITCRSYLFMINKCIQYLHVIHVCTLMWIFILHVHIHVCTFHNVWKL